MSDKLSDEQIRELADDTDSGRTTSGKRLFSDRNLLAFARALLAASPAPAIPAVHWQPIETAPKETELLGWREDCGVLLIMHTSFDRWASEAECDDIDEETLFQKDWFGTVLPGIMDRLEREQVPTHWMPLPVDPTDDALKAAPAISESEDAARLDFMVEQQAWIQWTVRDGSIRQCQVYDQDEDENYHILSGENRYFNTPREAIDAARKGEKS